MTSPRLLLALLACSLLAACATAPEERKLNRVVALDFGPHRAHPDLVSGTRQPVAAPVEEASPAVVAVAAADTAAAPVGKMDALGVRTQRSVYFDVDSAELKSDFLPLLQAHAEYLAGHPKARLRIEGNADERGSADYNQKLGMKRAVAVSQGLLAQGGVKTGQIKSISLGETKPKLAGHDEGSWSENRRADIIYEREE
ncbi:MAG: hypothetical protein RIR00_161 [Pseudomonadota bacterium]|jgi:peptidoglycan-associated lipoprotein